MDGAQVMAVTRGVIFGSLVPWCFDWHRAANECVIPDSERDVVIVPGASVEDRGAKPPNVVSMFPRPPTLKA